VVVHVDPVRPDHEKLPDTVRLLAGRQGLNAHDIRVHDVLGRRSLELHLEVNSTLRLDEAHRQATALEDALRQALPGIDQIVTHIEPDGEATATPPDMPANEAQVRQVLAALPREAGLDCHPHNITVHREAGELAVSFHCIMDPGAPIADAHALTEQVESALRARVPNLARVIVHIEPPEATDGNG
jgi:divalent metal cation (Fe/Co/Zn/Cd) transporter